MILFYNTSGTYDLPNNSRKCTLCSFMCTVDERHYFVHHIRTIVIQIVIIILTFQ